MLDFRIIDIISLSVGVAALLLAIVSLVIQRRRRLAELKPRLSLKLSWTITEDAPSGTIRLYVWNAGRPPISLRKVQLMWGREDKKTRETVGKIGFLPYDAAAGVPLSSTSDDSLYECEGRTFLLPPLPPSMMQRAASQPEGHVWIAIETPEGEIARIGGAEILPLLQRFLQPLVSD